MPRWFHPLSLNVMAAVLLFLTALPLTAQTSDVWTNTKISDLRRHQAEVSAPAADQLDMANRYLARVNRFAEQEDLSPRQQKKLDKAYRRAVRHLDEAIELEPEWLEPRLYLAALHYRLEAYEDSVRCYEEALAVDPDNEQVQGYLETARWHAERQREETAEPAGG